MSIYSLYLKLLNVRKTNWYYNTSNDEVRHWEGNHNINQGEVDKKYNYTSFPY